MRKSDIVKRTAAETYVTRLAAETGVNILLEEIATALARGEKVVIPGFGTFARTSRVARIGRNPRSGEDIEIPASNSVSFKASKALKDAIG